MEDQHALYRRIEDAQLMEFKCVEFSEELLTATPARRK
jgi:hypothetical protein